jgi:hypothetical protein
VHLTRQLYGFCTAYEIVSGLPRNFWLRTSGEAFLGAN